MANFPAANYISNAGRTQAEEKTAFEDWLAATKELPGGGGAPPTLTLSSNSNGNVSPTTALFLIDTFSGGASGSLANILQTEMDDGRMVLFRSTSSARVVTLKHAAGGTGQLSLALSADFVLADPSQWIILRRSGSTWEEIGRHYGNQRAALRTAYDLATIGAGVNTFTKRQEWAKGADLASASSLTLGTDGNFFHVTGTTTITGISSAPAGTRIMLYFVAPLTLTHSASLDLIGGESLVIAPGDRLEFVSEGSGTWRMVGGPGGSGGVDIAKKISAAFTCWDQRELIGVSTNTAPTTRWYVGLGDPPVILPDATGAPVMRFGPTYVGISDWSIFGFTMGLFKLSKNPTAAWRMAFKNQSSIGTSYADWFGFFGSAGDLRYGLYVGYSHAQWASQTFNILFKARNNFTETSVDTGVVCAFDAAMDFKLVVSANGASAQLYINNVAAGAAIATNLPGVALGWGRQAESGGGGFDVTHMTITQSR